jgi:hypothetical protein
MLRWDNGYFSGRIRVGRMRVNARVLLLGWACAVGTSACHRLYEIQGTIQVATSAVRKARLPSVLCSGPGGSLETSGVHGHPTERAQAHGGSPAALIFCSEPRAGETIPLRESIYYGSLPRQAHVYAWLAPVPAAESLCAEFKTDVVEVDRHALYRLRLVTQAATHHGDPSWPCGNKPSTGEPMSFAVTFDPDHKTWEEQDRGRWIERRALRIE